MSTSTAIPTGKLVHATPANAPFVEGRRTFLKYQDLGVTAASSGRLTLAIVLPHPRRRGMDPSPAKRLVRHPCGARSGRGSTRYDRPE